MANRIVSIKELFEEEEEEEEEEERRLFISMTSAMRHASAIE